MVCFSLLSLYNGERFPYLLDGRLAGPRISPEVMKESLYQLSYHGRDGEIMINGKYTASVL
jgi:hypothetical protein